MFYKYLNLAGENDKRDSINHNGGLVLNKYLSSFETKIIPRCARG